MQIIRNCQFAFQKDKTHKIIRFSESTNMIFLLNEQAPSKLYAIKLEALEDKGVDIQAAKKSFTYIYETSLSFETKLTNIIDFDCYLQERTTGGNQYMFFVRDKSKISLFGITESNISIKPSEEFEYTPSLIHI